MPHLKSTHCLLAGICICLFVIMFRRQIISAINICSTYTGDLSRIVYPASDNITEDTRKFISVIYTNLHNIALFAIK